MRKCGSKCCNGIYRTARRGKSAVTQKKKRRERGTILWPWAQMLKSYTRTKQSQQWGALVREEKLAARGIDLEQVCVVQLQIYTQTHTEHGVGEMKNEKEKKRGEKKERKKEKKKKKREGKKKRNEIAKAF